MVKVFVAHVGDSRTSLLAPKLSESDKKEYLIDEKLSLVEAIETLCVLFSASEPSGNYSLQKSDGSYLDGGDPLVHQDIRDGETLLLKVKPSICAARAVKALQQAKDDKEAKESMFSMRFELKDAIFAEEFFACNGMAAILHIVSRSRGNAQAYALVALSSAMAYVSGMESLLETPGLIDQLYALVGSSVVSVTRQTLELLFVLCNFRKSGFDSIHSVVEQSAKRAGAQPYAEIIALLDSGDLDTQVNALTLLNSVLKSADGPMAKSFLANWRSQGLEDRLAEKWATTEQETFQIQIKQYDEMNLKADPGAKSIITERPTAGAPKRKKSMSMFGSRSLRGGSASGADAKKSAKGKSPVTSVLESSAPSSAMIDRTAAATAAGTGDQHGVKGGGRSDHMLRVLRHHLRRQDAAIHEALQEGAYINAHAPLQRYADRKDMPSADPPDIARMMESTTIPASSAVGGPKSPRGDASRESSSHEEVVALRERIQSLASQVAKLKQVGKVLTEKKTTHEAEITRLEAENERLRSKIEPVGSSLREAIMLGDQGLSSHASDRELLMQARIDSLTEELKDSREQLEQAVERAAEQVKMAEESLLKPEEPNELIRKDLERLQQQVVKLRAIKEQVVKEMRSMAQGDSDGGTALRDMELEHAKSELDQERVAKEELKQRVEDLRARVGEAPLAKELQSQLAKAQEEANLAKKENTALRVQLLEAKMRAGVSYPTRRTSSARSEKMEEEKDQKEGKKEEEKKETSASATTASTTNDGEESSMHSSDGADGEAEESQQRVMELEQRLMDVQDELGRTSQQLDEEKQSKDKAVVQLKNMMKVMKILKEKYDSDVSSDSSARKMDEELSLLQEENADLLAEIEDLRELSQLQQEEKEALLKETEYANKSQAETANALQLLQKRYADELDARKDLERQLGSSTTTTTTTAASAASRDGDGVDDGGEDGDEDGSDALAAARAEIARVREEASIAQAECARDMAHAVEAVQMELVAMRGERDRLEVALKQSQDAVEASKSLVSDLKAAEAAATAALMEVSADANVLRAELAALEEAASSSSTTSTTSSGSSSSDAEARAAALAKENEEIKAKLSIEVAELKAQTALVAQTEVAHLQAECSRTAAQLASVEQQRDRLMESLRQERKRSESLQEETRRLSGAADGHHKREEKHKDTDTHGATTPAHDGGDQEAGQADGDGVLHEDEGTASASSHPSARDDGDGDEPPSVPTRPVVVPNVPMKPLFWRRMLLPTGDGGGDGSGDSSTTSSSSSSSSRRGHSVWDIIRREQIEEAPEKYSFPTAQFEEKFCRAQSNKKAVSDRSGFVVKALDTKRYQKVAIMMSSLPDETVLRDAIYNFDSSKLSRQQVRNLLDNLPKPQEVDNIMEAQEALPEGKLDRPEAFLMNLQGIPNIKNRLKCWLFMRALPETINNLEPPLLAIADASTELLESKSLQLVLGLVLSLGNHMNGGGERGQADAFSLDVLTKLTTVYGINKETSLLKYLSDLLKERHPDISTRLAGELSLLDEATDISLEKIEPSLRLLEEKLSKTLRFSRGIEDEAFKRTIVPFLEAASIQIRELKTQYHVANDKYHECVAYYVPKEGRHKYEKSSVFFQTLSQFVSQLKACIEPKRKPFSKGKIGGGEDPMASIIAAIRAGQTPDL